MADLTYNTQGVYIKQGGKILTVASGGVINIESGGVIQADGTQASALTTQLTTITPADGEGSPDYAIQAVTQTTPFGFVTAQELITFIYVVKNLQERLAEVEAALEGAGIVEG